MVKESVTASDQQAPDGGWGWCVVLSSFLAHVLSDGIVYTNGILLRHVRRHYEASRQTMGLLASLTLTVVFGSAFINGVLVTRWGCRVVGFVGGLVLALGLILSSFATSMEYLFFSTGIVAAWGIGLTHIPSIVSVAEYFYRKRSFATGLAVCGAGLGTFAYAPLVQLLLDGYDWRGTYLILGALSLNCSVCALVYRPLTSTTTNLPAEIYSHGDELKEEKSSVVAEGACERRTKWYSLPELYAVDLSDCTEVGLKEKNKMRSHAELRVPSREGEIDYQRRSSPISEDFDSSEAPALSDRDATTKKKKAGKVRSMCVFKQRFPILGKKSMLVWSVSAFLTGLSMPIVVTFLPDLAVEAGMSITDAALLISISGIASTISRALLGWAAGKPCVNRPFAFITSTFTTGISIGLCPLCSRNYVLLACMTAVHGTCTGYRIAQMPVVVAELVGIHYLATGVGLIFLVGSIGVLLGTPLAGRLFDKTGSYTLPFLLMGVVTVLGAVVNSLVLCTPEYKESRKRLKAERDTSRNET